MLTQHRTLSMRLIVRPATKLGEPTGGNSTGSPGTFYGIVSHRLFFEGPVRRHFGSLHSGGHYIKAEEIFYISQYPRNTPEESPGPA
jgi:hypothetical protein